MSRIFSRAALLAAGAGAIAVGVGFFALPSQAQTAATGSPARYDMRGRAPSRASQPRAGVAAG